MTSPPDLCLNRPTRTLSVMLVAPEDMDRDWTDDQVPDGPAFSASRYAAGVTPKRRWNSR